MVPKIKKGTILFLCIKKINLQNITNKLENIIYISKKHKYYPTDKTHSG